MGSTGRLRKARGRNRAQPRSGALSNGLQKSPPRRTEASKSHTNMRRRVKNRMKPCVWSLSRKRCGCFAGRVLRSRAISYRSCASVDKKSLLSKSPGAARTTPGTLGLIRATRPTGTSGSPDRRLPASLSCPRGRRRTAGRRTGCPCRKPDPRDARCRSARPGW
jgi:hypothetical protein